MPIAVVALGSNQGDRSGQLEQAIEHLRHLPDTDLLRHSRWIETDPVGGPPQGKFLNGVALLKTGLSLPALFQSLLEVERRMGRPAARKRWGPRVIDLDLISVDSQVVRVPGLEVPHPRMHERPFVLIPLAETAPEWRHPVLGKTAAELLLQVRQLP